MSGTSRFTWIRTAAGWTACVVVLGLVVGGVPSLVDRHSRSEVPIRAVTVTLRSSRFAAARYHIAADRPQRLQIRNTDRIMHTFTVPSLGIDRVVAPGGRPVIEVTAPAGTYVVYCRPHADLSEPDPSRAGMATTLVVR